MFSVEKKFQKQVFLVQIVMMLLMKFSTFSLKIEIELGFSLSVVLQDNLTIISRFGSIYFDVIIFLKLSDPGTVTNEASLHIISKYTSSAS